MTYVTDFADQAVMLPVIVAMALTLAAVGWWRGAVAWLFAVGACFAAVLGLKVVFCACGVGIGGPALRSPSGHTAAAAMLTGGIAVMMGAGRHRVAAAAILGVVVIGITRLVLALHTPAEVLLGGMFGVAGALGFARLAGPVPPLRLRWLFAVIVVVALLLHGRHLNAEPRICAPATGQLFCAPFQAWW